MMTTQLTLHTTVTLAKQQVSCNLAGEAVLLNLATGQYFGLNSVGARIWDLLQERRTLLEIRDQLVSEYPEVDAVRCTSELLDLLSELVDAQLVNVST